jgi:hypothetical protein
MEAVRIGDCAIEIDSVTREQWTEMLENFSDASIYQTWDYGAVRWGERNLSHMVVREKGEVISAAQVRILRMPVIRQGMAYVFYGPMWKMRDKARCLENLQAGLRALIDEYAIKRRLFLRLRPWGFIEHDSDMRAVLIKEGFRLTNGIFRDKKRTILVDLTASEDVMRKRLKKKWRQTLQRAEREDLNIVEGFDAGLFDYFKPLLLETIKLKRFKPGSDVDEFAQIQEKLVPAQRLRITMCKAGNKYVSGSVCSSVGNISIGLLSATGETGRRLQAYYLLQWDEILWAKRAGKNRYDLGGINPEANPGVYRFKAGLGGEELTLVGVFDFCRNRLLSNAILTLEHLLLLRERVFR